MNGDNGIDKGQVAHKKVERDNRWIVVDDGLDSKVELPRIHVGSVKEGGEVSPNLKDSKGQRLTRYIVYWIGIGLFIDIALYFARYRRYDESHDETHGALMFLAFGSSTAMDIWFLVKEYHQLFKERIDIDVYFFLICGTTVFSLFQISTF